MYYSDLVDSVQPGINAPEFVVEGKIQDAVIQFCQETGLWAKDLTAITTEADEDTYALLSIDGVITAVLSVKDDSGYEIPFTVEDDFSAITLGFTPTSVFAITPRVTLIPEADGLGECPDFIYLRHREAIIAGARWKLFEMPNRVWSNDQEALKCMLKFRAGITRANQSVLLGRTKTASVSLIPFV